MLLDSFPKLDEILIPLLAERPFVSANWLHAKVARTSRQFTVQAIYKELRKLESSGVVVKAAGKYSLTLAWVFDLIRLSDTVKQVYLDNLGKLIIVDPSIPKQKWKFSNLLTLDRFWGYIILALYKQSKSRIMFQWIPHPWFELAQYELNERFTDAMRLIGAKAFVSVGDDSSLDQQYAKLWPKDLVEYSHAVGPFHGKLQSKYLCVIDDFVLTVSIDKHNVVEIEDIFDNTSTVNRLDRSRVLRLFNLKGNHTICLEMNRKKAAQLAAKFRDFFGIKSPAKSRPIRTGSRRD